MLIEAAQAVHLLLDSGQSYRIWRPSVAGTLTQSMESGWFNPYCKSENYFEYCRTDAGGEIVHQSANVMPRLELQSGVGKRWGFRVAGDGEEGRW